MFLEVTNYLMALTTAAYIDYKTFKIPNILCGFIMLLAFFTQKFELRMSIYSMLMILPICIFMKFKKAGGYGDVKFILSNAFYLQMNVFVGLLISFLLLMTQEGKKTAYAPYFLCGFGTMAILRLLNGGM